jgi:hypothetical protein
MTEKSQSQHDEGAMHTRNMAWIRKIVPGLILLIVPITALGCAAQRAHTIREEDYELSVRTAYMRDPVADVQAAIKRRDYRFITVRGLGVGTPGLINLYPQIEDAYGSRMIEGTSDTISIDNMDVAEEYATIYNLILRRHLRATEQWKLDGY